MSDHEGGNGGWMPGEPGVPIDTNLEGNIVTSIGAMSVVWNMHDPNDPEVSILAPMLIVTFYTRTGEVGPLVFSLGGLSSLMSDISEHFVSVLGGVAPISGELTDEGLQRMINDVLDKGDDQ